MSLKEKMHLLTNSQQTLCIDSYLWNVKSSTSPPGGNLVDGLPPVCSDENVIFSEIKFEAIFVTGALQRSSWRVQRRSGTLIAEKQRHWNDMPGLKVILLQRVFGPRWSHIFLGFWSNRIEVRG